MVKVDVKLIVDILFQLKSMTLKFGDYIMVSKHIPALYTHFRICFVRRNANLLVHCLLMTPKSFLSSHYGVESPNIRDDLLDTYCSCTLIQKIYCYIYKKKRFIHNFNIFKNIYLILMIMIKLNYFICLP